MPSEGKKDFVRGFLSAQGLSKEEIEKREKDAEEEERKRIESAQGGYLVRESKRK